MSEETKDIPTAIDVLRIMELIPHRYPMLLIDGLKDIEAGETAVGVKNVTINEHFFQGHFPDQPVMPGVLIVEAMAQTAAAMVMLTLGQEAEGKIVYFMSIDGAKFRRPVVPGDQLELHVKKEQNRRNVWKFSGQGKVNGQLVAEATYTAMIVED
ncbi:3-hydroxyacyl-ACP dehydratase FabZ [Emcibacter nanhaiensis]|uniref:3-hydroxyacyl-[acyl-carrier-protein] dehydratase FabZ n=1 Tax=Emcibacter nanhaiensis TaxID=1505037 RepID=A0A501PRP3_9PROT|nr:3-hydroxyacyl-ACP dehydratase FabZ [Emcibacter nanhaiensis]TPD62915.1 3-hydroxyacyl-ACP dehydratase FabZ [Emcibacter nanhaiensis]